MHETTADIPRPSDPALGQQPTLMLFIKWLSVSS